MKATLIQKQEIIIGTSAADVEKGCSFLENVLQRYLFPKTVISETRFVCEAILQELADLHSEEELEINLSTHYRFGSVLIKIGFEGDIFTPDLESKELSVENTILKTYDDRIDYSYLSGYNNITVFVKRSWWRDPVTALLCIALAVAVYVLLLHFSDETHVTLLFDNVIIPLEKLFANAVLMIGAPVTFLSLLNNLTDLYIISERNSEARWLHFRTFASSLIVVLLAVAAAFFFSDYLEGNTKYRIEYSGVGLAKMISDLLESIMPSSIFSPFEVTSPFPIIVLSILMTYALCSSGKYFNALKKTIQTGYYLFSRMLAIVVFFLPFFFFIATLHLFIEYGFKSFGYLLEFIALAAVALPPLILFYLLRLIIGRVDLRKFFSGLLTFMKENITIDSAIDAVPFNIRYCIREYDMDRKKLEGALPILAQVNLDGNCYVITLISVLVLLQNGIYPKWFEIAMIGILIFVLSLGAPNQPGSCLIGFTTVLAYLQTYSLLHMVIISEVMYGSMINLINVTGDLVTVAIENADRKKDRTTG